MNHNSRAVGAQSYLFEILTNIAEVLIAKSDRCWLPPFQPDVTANSLNRSVLENLIMKKFLPVLFFIPFLTNAQDPIPKEQWFDFWIGIGKIQ